MISEQVISDSLEASVRTKKQFWSEHRVAFFEVAKTITQALKSNQKVLIFGNGGSACDAMHFAGELVNRYSKERRALACIALTADAPLATCIANDSSFDRVFERQVEALGRPGDVAIGISTSGKSANVEKGLKAAQNLGLKTIGLTGGSGGTMLSNRWAEQILCVTGSTSTPRIQETHEWILHSLCECIDSEF
jgi:D-sedoheptulose 7-phosphate isomerase